MDRTYKSVKADTLSIALRSIESLSRKNVAASIYYIWSAGLVHGASISLSFIQQDYDLSNLDILQFDSAEMNRLFRYGHDLSVGGRAWITRESVDNMEDLQEMLDIYDMMEPSTPGTEGEDELRDLSED